MTKSCGMAFSHCRRFSLLLTVSTLLLCLSGVRANYECSCKLSELEDFEKLNKLLNRIRIEYSDGIRKYPSLLQYDAKIECHSNVLYELIIDPEKGKIEKRCRVCKTSGWSELSECTRFRCDRDLLVGQPILRLANAVAPADDQRLFEPGSVLATFKYSKDKVCKVCQMDGEWSRFPEADLCKEIKAVKPNSDCKIDTLKQMEIQQYDYIRIRIEAPNGLFKYTDQNILNGKVPGGSVVVYQRYLSNLPTSSRSTMDYNSGNPFTKKFCRYCDLGVWSELESCVKLNCDREQLTGDPELFFVSNKLKPIEQQILFPPYSVIAVSTFGQEKFCKQCHENGEWSRYSLKELCEPPTHGGLRLSKVTATRHHERNSNRIKPKNNDEMYKREATCDLANLKTIEEQTTLYEKLYYVSPDRRHRLHPEQDAKIPSRTLSLYKSKNRAVPRQYCSLCVNGIWSNITSDCTSDSGLYFCERDKLMTFSSELVDEEGPVSITDDLFEPGTVMAVYELSETTKLCKICESLGDAAKWSDYAESGLCDPDIGFFKSRLKAKMFMRKPCEMAALRDEYEFSRESVQTWDGKHYLVESSVPDSSMAVFKSDSMDLSVAYLKWCRKCNDGNWDANFTICPIEFSLRKCDPLKLRGYDYLVYTNDGSRLSDEEKSELALPGKIAAVYEFGPQRYCKICNEDGTWSSYPQTTVCDKINWNN